jgi:VanZ family protein
MARQRSSAWPLAAACACLIGYASLHPFAGWTLPPDLGPELLWPRVPRPRYVSDFDIIANVLAYVPLGALVAAGTLRDGRPRWLALLRALLACTLLGYAMETLQQFLPRRVPSVIDWGLNCGGGALGALAMLGIAALGGLELWQRWRERWFLRGRGAGLTLLLLWPFGLLFPPPLPFGLGQVLLRARETAAGLLAGTAWDGWLAPVAAGVTPLARGVEVLGVAAGLLAPCLLAYALTRPGPHRLVLTAGALALGTGAATLSTALNFGPDHALAWLTPPVLPAAALAVLVALPLAWVPVRAAAGIGLLVLSLLLALVNEAPSDPYYAASLHGWEQGRFIRFHGLSQWIGWLWPWATLAYLLGRVGARTTERD